MMHYKEISVSYKTKRRQIQSRDKWERKENTHPAIVDRETWELVQRRFLHKGRLPRTNEPNIFQRIVRCADCGKQMWLSGNQRSPCTGLKTERRYFHCATYREFGKIKCTIHSTNYKAVQFIVLQDIREYARLAVEHPEALLQMLTESENKQKQASYVKAQKDYASGTKRLEELEVLLRRLFEGNVAGRINDENYEIMFSRYQAEQQGLKQQVEMLSKQLTAMGEIRDNSQRWMSLIAKYKDLQELDAPIVNELCEKIMLHQAYRVNGRRMQQIEIFYRFVGKLTAVNGRVEHKIRGSRHLCVNK